MRAIYKYPLGSVGLNVVSMPKDAIILSCALQREVPALWAIVSDSDPVHSSRRFLVVGTGHALPDEVDAKRFINTLQRDDGIVLHVFEDL